MGCYPEDFDLVIKVVIIMDVKLAFDMFVNLVVAVWYTAFAGVADRFLTTETEVIVVDFCVTEVAGIHGL